MGKEYAKVLKNMSLSFVVVGRSEKSATDFKNETGIDCKSGGLNNWLENNQVPEWAIVTVTGDQLGITTRELISAGCKNILVEKPGGLDNADLKLTLKSAKKFKTDVFVAYNRRFYASTLKADEIIKKDGGVKSFYFDFTERSSIIEALNKPNKIKRGWFLHNSTHVIDMAFFLGGKPSKITPYKKRGGLKWHPSGSIYVGAGISDNYALFSYHANWESAGRWGLEIMTPKSKLIFRPLEKLQIQKYGSMNIEDVPLDDKLDIEFKPGIYRQVESFLGNRHDLPTIDEQVGNLKYYSLIEKR